MPSGSSAETATSTQSDLPKKVVAVYDIPPGAVSGAKLQVKDLFSDSRAEIDLGQ